MNIFSETKNILKNPQGIVKTATFRQSTITFVGTIINGALGAVFYILSARFMGPASFGLMSVVITTISLLSDIGDFGTNTGIVRFVGKYFNEDKEKSYKYLKLGLDIKVLVGVLVLFVGLILAPFFAENVFHKNELTILLRIGSFGVLFTLIYTFAVTIFQVFQKFWLWSFVQIGTNFLRLLVILTLLFLGGLTAQTNLLNYVTMPLLGFTISLIFFIPKDFLKVKNEKAVFKDIFNYNKWVAAFTIISSLSSRMDTFISARLLSSSDLGIYAAANQLVQIMPQIIAAFGTVVAPKMAGMGSFKSFWSYFKKTQILVLGLALIAILLLPVANYFIPIFYGNAYHDMIPIFMILFLAQTIFLISVPIHNSIFYYYSYPKLFLFLNVGYFLIVTIGSWKLIPVFGIMGAAFSVLIGTTFNFIIPAFWVSRKILKDRKQ